MPELPEVETIRTDLNKYIKDKTITSLEVRMAKFINLPIPAFQKALVGQKIKQIERRAKILIFELSNEQFLLNHLKLTGQLIYRHRNGQTIKGGHNIKTKDEVLPNKYTYLIFTFSDKSQLFYNDLRQFGWFKLFKKDKLEKEISQLGVEPLEESFTFEKFEQILEKNLKSKIKPLLMKQEKIAGLGNIYADEVCFYARVLPQRIIKILKEKEKHQLFLGIKTILEKAIEKRGSSIDMYTDAKGQKGGYVPFLKVYDREGEKCKVCNSKIQKIKLAGRGTHFCPKCQK